jgi:hypothetical protein
MCKSTLHTLTTRRTSLVTAATAGQHTAIARQYHTATALHTTLTQQHMCRRQHQAHQ